MKNSAIQLWRFLFSVYMVVYQVCGHVYGIQLGGYIGVDIFFLVSGYFLASSYENRKTAETEMVKNVNWGGSVF